jgi:hypothetical protein
MTRFSSLIAAFVGVWLVAGLAYSLQTKPSPTPAGEPEPLSQPQYFEDWLAGVALRTKGDHRALTKEEADRLVSARGINALHALRAKWLQVRERP